MENSQAGNRQLLESDIHVGDQQNACIFIKGSHLDPALIFVNKNQYPGQETSQVIRQESAKDLDNLENSNEHIDERSMSTAMTFPSLSNDAPTTLRSTEDGIKSENEDEDLANSQNLPISTSSIFAAQPRKGSAYQKVGKDGVCSMHRFKLYETASHYYLVGADIGERKYRILKIDRTVDPGELSVAEDDIIYAKKELVDLLDTVRDGNKSNGGMKLKCALWGLLGFIKFTGTYYMLLITKRKQVAMIGGHYIYQVDGTELVPLTMPSSRFRMDGDAEEARFVGILNNLDLTRSFYFSYSYDITHTLQDNILRERKKLNHDKADTNSDYRNAMFVWNHHLLDLASNVLQNAYDWCLPIVHGFVRQSSKHCSLFSGIETESFGSLENIWPKYSYNHYRQAISVFRRCALFETRCERFGKHAGPLTRTRPC